MSGTTRVLGIDMNPEHWYEISCKEIRESENNNIEPKLTLVLKKGMKIPRGFPRGLFLSETEYGVARHFDPRKIISWLVKNNLIEPKHIEIDLTKL